MLGLRKLPGPSQNMSKISQATHMGILLTSFPTSYFIFFVKLGGVNKV